MTLKTCAALLLLTVIALSSSGSRAFDLSASISDTEHCFVPDRYDPAVPFSGFIASASVPLATVVNAFPSEWEGRSRIGVGFALRPPGLALSFAEPVDILQAFVTTTRHRVTFDPPEIASPNPPSGLDSVSIYWSPVEGSEAFGSTTFWANCDFVILLLEHVTVSAEATGNLLAVYAAPGDTVQVWGTEVGIQDVSMAGTLPTVPWNPVEPSTWGAIKVQAAVEPHDSR